MDDYYLVNLGSTTDRFAKISPQDAGPILLYKWRITHSRKGTERIYYAAANERGTKPRVIKMHRLILSAPDGWHVDHINGDGLDNRRENLRLVNPQLNQANSRKHKPGTSRFKGVCWSRKANKWRAYVSVDRRQIHIGLYEEEMAAAQAYDLKAKELWGEHAHLNLA